MDLRSLPAFRLVLSVALPPVFEFVFAGVLCAPFRRRAAVRLHEDRAAVLAPWRGFARHDRRVRGSGDERTRCGRFRCFRLTLRRLAEVRDLFLDGRRPLPVEPQPRPLSERQDGHGCTPVNASIVAPSAATALFSASMASPRSCMV